MHEGKKVKSVSRESVSETTDRVSREFRESKKSEMHRLRIVGSIAYSRVDPECGAVGSIPFALISRE